MLSERGVVVHNGWITNHEEVVERFRGRRPEDPETDSFAINVVLEAWLDAPGDRFRSTSACSTAS